MSTQHTPGPWVVNLIQLNQIATADAKLEIARATVLRDQHKTIANARLIAAAPDLLEALKACNQALIEAADFMPINCEAAALCEQAECISNAAIAKAMGAA